MDSVCSNDRKHEIESDEVDNPLESHALAIGGFHSVNSLCISFSYFKIQFTKDF